jgi:branched-chain amino acid transport system ATP-binding protein
VSQRYSPPSTAAGPSAPAPVLQVRGLTKRFGGMPAVQAVSFDLGPGEVLAMIGPNGAGKSTCFNLLTGQLRADAGSVRFAGRELLGLRPNQIWRLGVGRTFQVAETFASLTVLENVQVALASLHREELGLGVSLHKRFRVPALALLERVGMADQAGRPCGILAYGDLKRVELALALANAPRLLLMDEPTAGMALGERDALMALIAGIVRENGTSVLFTEHDMDMVFAHAHTVLVLDRGEFAAQGPPAAVRDHARVREIYLGSGAAFDPGHPPLRGTP